jgi:hypothetical protein
MPGGRAAEQLRRSIRAKDDVPGCRVCAQSPDWHFSDVSGQTPDVGSQGKVDLELRAPSPKMDPERGTGSAPQGAFFQTVHQY